jgi:hypothetical protein
MRSGTLGFRILLLDEPHVRQSGALTEAGVDVPT